MKSDAGQYVHDAGCPAAKDMPRGLWVCTCARADQSTATPAAPATQADAARPVLHFTGSADLLATFLRVRHEITRDLSLKGRAYMEAGLRVNALERTLRTGATP